jgi:hypothetical protein
MIHELVGKHRVISYHIDLVTFCGMNNIIYGDVPVKQAAMRIVVAILPVEEETTTTLRIKIPE